DGRRQDFSNGLEVGRRQRARPGRWNWTGRHQERLLVVRTRRARGRFLERERGTRGLLPGLVDENRPVDYPEPPLAWPPGPEKRHGNRRVPVSFAFQTVPPKGNPGVAQPDAPPQQQGGGGGGAGGGAFGLLFPLLIMVPFLFLMFRRQKKEQEARGKL